MKNPFRKITIEEKIATLLERNAHRLFEAHLASIEHNHYIQRIEKEIAFLRQGQRIIDVQKESPNDD